MQSGRYSFCGDVVSDSYNEEDNILDHIFKGKYVRILCMMILILFITLYENAYYGSTKTQFYEFLVLLCFISLIMHFLQSFLKFKIFIIKILRYLLFILLVLNTVFIPVEHVKAVQDDISAKTVPI